MAQYDVYSIAGTEELFLDLQSDNIDGLNTKTGVPLVLKNQFLRPIRRLQPEFVVHESTYVMLTQHFFAVPTSDLRHKVSNLESESFRISGAIDLLLYGI